MRRVLVVGAGFAGAVHARILAERGIPVHVIDRRDHIAGNCYDTVDANGLRIHRYGPHLFHTSNRKVVEWLSQFTEWTPYAHRVVARLADGAMVPLPVNLDTINAVFDTQLDTADAVTDFLASVAESRTDIRTAEDHLYSTIGPTLTDLFFRPYTRKMWGHDLREIDAAVVRRLQIRMDRDNRYFLDDFQAMPRNGYTALFTRIFDHPNIRVTTGCTFDQAMLRDYDFCFNSMPIDVFFDGVLGDLPYRSIRFHHDTQPREGSPSHTTINYTDDSRFTRETWWHNLPDQPDQNSPNVIRTREEPCDYRDNDLERYYPVRRSDGRYEALYQRYCELARAFPDIAFIGRCGTYQYLDMHQVINQSMTSAGKWLARHLSDAA